MTRYQYTTGALQVLERSVIPFAVYQRIDNRSVPLVLSAGFCRLFGLEKEEAYDIMSHNKYRHVHPDDVDRLIAAVRHFSDEGGNLNIVYRLKTRKWKDNMVVHAQGEHITAEDGNRLAIVWFTSEGFYSSDDESENTLAHSFNVMLREETMIRQASYDALTGLPNMATFFKQTDAARNNSQAKDASNAIVYFDFCGLTAFNRNNGFAEGDKLLREFSNLLVRFFSFERCCRLSQDNFAVYTNADGLELKLEKLFKECRSLNGGKTLPVRAGIYVDDKAGLEIGVACDRAKTACDINRGNYKSVYQYFNEEMLAQEANRQYILDNLDRALQEKWIQVYYQPIIRTANNNVCNSEALARWLDPEKGLLSPAEFIPVLEDASVIYKLDLYVVEEVLERMQRQIAEGLLVIPVSVNLSRSDFDACDVVEEIRRRVDEAGIGRDKLNIEITETVIGKDFEFMKEQVKRFRQLGFPVWMDDFGSGYSSLDLLQEIRFDVIKFDLRFMKQFDATDRTKIILTELMKMATGLGIETVTEGVETKEQVAFLREIGCTRLQGFYYSKPLPMEEILRQHQAGTLIRIEDPQEADYYSAIGNINLYDPSFIARDSRYSLQEYFNTIPAAILELQGDEVMIVRCNRPYREYVRNTIGLQDETMQYIKLTQLPGSTFVNALKRCKTDEKTVLLSGKFKGTATIDTYLDRIAVNPVSGAVAVAVIVLRVSKQ